MRSSVCVFLVVAASLGCDSAHEPGGLRRTASGADGGGAARKDVAAASPQGQWKSAVYAWYDDKTGNCFLKVSEYVLQKAAEPRQFRFVGLWRYDASEDRWKKVDFAVEAPASVKATGRRVYGASNDETVVNLPHEIGLYWVVWREDGHRVGAPLTCGPVLCNDLPDTTPPKGKVWACVPYRTSATATLVPDPEIHCRE